MELGEIALEREAYNVIKREVKNFQRTTTDAELANYVRGVVDLQTELYGIMQMQEETKSLNDKDLKPLKLTFPG